MHKHSELHCYNKLPIASKHHHYSNKGSTDVDQDYILELMLFYRKGLIFLDYTGNYVWIFSPLLKN